VHLARREAHLVRILVARDGDPAQDLAHLGFVVDQPQQRLAVGASAADAEDVFCGRIQVDNQQVIVQQDDP
jgi:hypothetical protein